MTFNIKCNRCSIKTLNLNDFDINLKKNECYKTCRICKLKLKKRIENKNENECKLYLPIELSKCITDYIRPLHTFKIQEGQYFYMPAETFYLSYANRTLPDKEFNQLEHHIFIKKVKYLDNIVKIEGTLYIGNINESEEVINFQIELKNNKYVDMDYPENALKREMKYFCWPLKLVINKNNLVHVKI
tara:strand:+ start:993 stop:1553 length:561 start_codon:yes stop_codon:yes gene_type:complete